ncbi:murein hydrolase activator EnvC family protein [Gracilimonas mengyeensis]|uniref:Septal ring factor EnvC, activator of murein hydrolases AmiA and AmiB n=1 Tax=Gracilimonas mengyeensis TaxID=1302730 RepID=A0A521CD19_9BACT|nr:peptidoglycan DD-metalloendopeptidase family protein [Gracilimonas mengyeensis]SMO57314.1 Septal ring factor EnvC, activator of murein hydrolases AmiA and AmiB [Gracilimonas mengyeensis]
MKAHSYLLKVCVMILLAALAAVEVSAQSTYEEKREELLKRQENARAEINVLEARIKNYQERVRQAEQRFDKSFEQFQSLNNLIALQDDKIKSLQQEQSQIEAEIRLTEEEISVREAELNHLIESYKKIISYAYKNGRTGNLELLLTSKSINQMVVRANYLRRFEEQKAKQAEAIRETKRELDEVKENLEDSHQKNRVVLGEIREEKEELGDQRQQQEQTVEEIKQERSEWLSELRKTRQEKENLENTFSSLIEEEEELRAAENERLRRLEEARNITDASRRASEVEKYESAARSTNFVSDEELAVFEDEFAKAKGDLPWPVNSTTVAKQFGRVRNPLYGTITEHPGIDIVADAGSPVKAVADGYVFRIRPLPGYGDVVFVKHGSYYTAYGNLSQIDVGVGTVLRQGDRIGSSGTSQSELGEVLFFLLRDGNQNVNPVSWLK